MPVSAADSLAERPAWAADGSLGRAIWRRHAWADTVGRAFLREGLASGFAAVHGRHTGFVDRMLGHAGRSDPGAAPRLPVVLGHRVSAARTAAPAAVDRAAGLASSDAELPANEPQQPDPSGMARGASSEAITAGAGAPVGAAVPAPTPGRGVRRSVDAAAPAVRATVEATAASDTSIGAARGRVLGVPDHGPHVARNALPGVRTAPPARAAADAGLARAVGAGAGRIGDAELTLAHHRDVAQRTDASVAHGGAAETQRRAEKPAPGPETAPPMPVPASASADGPARVAGGVAPAAGAVAPGSIGALARAPAVATPDAMPAPVGPSVARDVAGGTAATDAWAVVAAARPDGAQAGSTPPHQALAGHAARAGPAVAVRGVAAPATTLGREPATESQVRPAAARDAPPTSAQGAGLPLAVRPSAPSAAGEVARGLAPQAPSADRGQMASAEIGGAMPPEATSVALADAGSAGTGTAPSTANRASHATGPPHSPHRPQSPNELRPPHEPLAPQLRRAPHEPHPSDPTGPTLPQVHLQRLRASGPVARSIVAQAATDAATLTPLATERPRLAAAASSRPAGTAPTIASLRPAFEPSRPGSERPRLSIPVPGGPRPAMPWRAADVVQQASYIAATADPAGVAGPPIDAPVERRNANGRPQATETSGPAAMVSRSTRGVASPAGLAHGADAFPLVIAAGKRGPSMPSPASGANGAAPSQGPGSLVPSEFDSAAAAPSLQRSIDSLPAPTDRFDPGPVAPQTASADPQPAAASSARAATQAAQPAVDVDELVERALQALMFRLDIERERRGFTRWT